MYGTPLPYITAIGSHLLTLPQQLEPFADQSMFAQQRFAVVLDITSSPAPTRARSTRVKAQIPDDLFEEDEFEERCPPSPTIANDQRIKNTPLPQSNCLS